jgi:penicillin amidase
MATMFKWLSRAFVGAVIIGLAALLLTYYLVGHSIPDYERDFAVNGPAAPVRIIRDAYAVPHIFGETDRDVFFAFGFVHAQERLWQMETNRRAAQGRLSELFGEITYSFDRFVRALDLYALSREAVAVQDPEVQAALEAYAEGVNAWIRTVREEALGRGAPEFFLFGAEIAPWTPADSISIAKLMALRLSDQAQVETQRAALSLVLQPERLRDILPDYPEPALIAAPEYASLFPGETFAPTFRRAEAMQAMPPAGRGGASNAWAVSAKRAAAAAPVLANDPHLWLSAPSLWMLARLEFPDGGVIGGSVPGMPLILVGRSAELAWGMTYAYVDEADLYIEKLNPDNPDEYLTPDGWTPFTTRDTLTPSGHVAALSWTALTPEDRSVTAGYGLMRAKSIGAAAAALAHQVSPAMNITLADRNGVAMVTAGRAPLRDPRSSAKGRLPAPGWTTANDWIGYMPFAELPKAMRPTSGAVANANNRTTDAAFPKHLSFHWGDPYRIRRIKKQLSQREFHTGESAAALQHDNVSEMARAVLPLIARQLWWTEDAVPQNAREELRREALEMLGDWNGEMSEHRPEPLIFYEWTRRLTIRLAADELGPALSLVEGQRPLFIERVFRDVDGAAIWCDVNKTVRAETCKEMARLALDDALGALSEQFGANPRGWRWGEAHMARHENAVFGRIGLLNLVANLEHESSGGDFTVQRAETRGAGPTPHAVAAAGGYRGVYDFADPDNSRYIISTGQSGHPLSRHYDDLSELWRRGDYIRMSLDPRDAEAGTLGVSVLTPAE